MLLLSEASRRHGLVKYAKPQVFNCSSLNSFSRRHDLLHVGWKRIVHKRIFQSHQEKSGSNKTSFEVFKFCASIHYKFLLLVVGGRLFCVNGLGGYGGRVRYCCCTEHQKSKFSLAKFCSLIVVVAHFFTS